MRRISSVSSLAIKASWLFYMFALFSCYFNNCSINKTSVRFLTWVPGRSFKTFAISWVKAMVVPVVMYGCESWTIKKAEDWRIDAFKLWYWRKLLRVPWTARRSNQCILKEIRPECSLEGLMLKLKLQYFGHLMQRTDYLKRHDAGKDWRRRGQQRMRWLDSITTQWTCIWVNSGRWVMDREAWHVAVHGVAKSQTRLNNWTELTWVIGYLLC